MANVPDNAAPPSAPLPAHVPSVFISYASEDRAAARALRDTLGAAGLDVWYDEQELTGGDAWDQKLRRQIRECEYFMPLISATTEARKEGYFRREWRLASERSLDMADDVLFIVPVVIDETSEQGARVPDKFLTVQWLRAPGGNATPALHHLIRRMLAGDHHAAPRPAGATRAPFQRTQAPFGPPPLTTEPPPLERPSEPVAPSRIPPMPTVPEQRSGLHAIRFILEVIWWALTVLWTLFTYLPRWARVLVAAWLVFSLFSYRCTRSSDSRPPPRNPPGRTADTPEQIRAVADRLQQAARDGRLRGEPGDIAKIGAEIARGFAEGFNETAATGKGVVVVPFAPPTAEDAGDKFAHSVFVALYGELSLQRRGDVGVTAPPKGEMGDIALLARAKRLNATFVLTGKSTDTAPYSLNVRLLNVATGNIAWGETYAIEGTDPTTVAEKIGEQIRPLLPKKEPRRPDKEKDKP